MLYRMHPRKRIVKMLINAFMAIVLSALLIGFVMLIFGGNLWGSVIMIICLAIMGSTKDIGDGDA